MDSNAKWDWQNMVLFNPRTAEGPKQRQTTDWGIEQGEGIMCKGPFSLFEGKGSSSGSELAPGCSARSSISVCTDSSFKEVMRYTHVDFGNINAFSGDFRGKEELDESSPPLDYSHGSRESMIGLELGKRMYFENNGTGGNTNGVPHPSLASSVKKIKSSKQITTSRCQVEGCNIDLSSAKDYHRKHKVCAAHSKFPKVVVKGLERRFCQQCSRFHSLSEFDEKKRSCRKRLSEHNTRRRKQQLHPIQFNAMRLPSPFSAFTSSDGRRQMSPHVYSSRSSSECTWENGFGPKLMSTKEEEEEEEGVMLNFGQTQGFNEHLQLAGTRALNLPGHSPNMLLPSKKSTKLEILSRGCEEPVGPPNMDSAPDFQRALSLLSNEAWTTSYPNNSVGHSMNHRPLMDHHSTHYDTSHFQLFKSPYQDVLHSNLFN